MHINRFMGAHMDDMARANRFEIEIHGPKGIRSRGIRCKTVSLPGRQIQTTEHREYPGGPMRQYPIGIDYDSGESSLTFMLDTTYEDKQKIELWQALLYDEAWGYAYVEDIWGEIKITQLGRDTNEIYSVTLHECWPTSIDSEDLDASGEPEIMEFSCTFAFRTWSSSYENTPSGLLGGLFKKFSRKIKTKTSSKIEGKLFG